MAQPPPTLTELRAQIRSLDDQILQLVAERLQVAGAIGRLKAQASLPIKDYRVEKEVIDRSRERARSLGLYETLAEDIARLLIRYSVAAQDEYHGRRKRQEREPSQRILIVGGGGRMGLWLSEFFESFGHEVRHFEPLPAGETRFPQTPSLAAGAADSSVIVLASPISATAAVIEELTALRSQALIFDICSLKTPLLPALTSAAAQGLRIASAHPMFGPQVDLLAGRTIVICHVASAEATAATRALFEGTTASLFETPVERHDLLMSYVLGLSHLVNLVFADVLRQSGLPFAELQQAASTTFTAQLAVTAAVVGENPDLYFEIQAENQFTAELVARLRRSLDSYGQAALGQDREEFRAQMAADCTYLNGAPLSSRSGPS